MQIMLKYRKEDGKLVKGICIPGDCFEDEAGSILILTNIEEPDVIWFKEYNTEGYVYPLNRKEIERLTKI